MRNGFALSIEREKRENSEMVYMVLSVLKPLDEKARLATFLFQAS